MVNNSKRSENKILWPDAIRIISVFFVILIHTSAPVVLSWKQVNAADWMFANIYDSIARVSVPLFVMLSGALLINKNDNLKTFFKKRLKRILLPWIFWGTILLLISGPKIDIYNFKTILMENFLSGFWFMPMIAGIYLATPIIKKFAVNATKNELKYFLTIWFLIASLIPSSKALFSIDISFINPSWVTYLGYFVGGYYIVHRSKISKNYLQLSKIIYFLNLFFTIVGTYLLSVNSNQFSGHLYEYLSINVLFMSFSSFILLFNYLKKIKIKNLIIQYVHLISENSFGIMLSHIILIKYLNLPPYPLVTIPLSTLIIFFISFSLIAALKKISILKFIVG